MISRLTKWINNGRQNLFAWSLGFYITLLGLNSVVNTFAYGTSWDSIFLYGIYLIYILFAIPMVVKHTTFKSVMIFMVFLLFALISMSVNNGATSERVVPFLLTVLPFFLLGMSMEELHSLKGPMTAMTVVVLIAAVAHFVFSLFGNAYVHDMVSAYGVLPMATFSLYLAFGERKVRYYIVAALMFVVLVMFGVRGPLVVYLICMVGLLFYFAKPPYLKALLILLTILTAAYIYSSQYISTLENLNNTLSQYGMHNRLLERILDQTFTDDNGRAQLNDALFVYINEHWLLGMGMFADREIIGIYAHNLFLEFWMDYGIIIGTFFGLFVVVRCVKLLILHRKDSVSFCVIIAVMSMGVGQLMFSSSYLESPLFFLLLGLLLNNRLNVRKKNTIDLRRLRCFK